MHNTNTSDIRTGKITLENQEKNGLKANQISSMDKVSNAVQINPYGLYTNLKKNQRVLVINLNGKEDNKIIIGTNLNGDKKDLKAGEVSLANLEADIFITFRNNGKIEIKGDCHFENDLSIDGKIEVKGDIKATGDIVAGSISLKNHMHLAGTLIAPTGGGSVSGITGSPT